MAKELQFPCNETQVPSSETPVKAAAPEVSMKSGWVIQALSKDGEVLGLFSGVAISAAGQMQWNFSKSGTGCILFCRKEDAINSGVPKFDMGHGVQISVEEVQWT